MSATVRDCPYAAYPIVSAAALSVSVRIQFVFMVIVLFNLLAYCGTGSMNARIDPGRGSTINN
jgi:hypothetical protein